MKTRRILTALAVLAIVTALAIAGVLTYDTWRGWLFPDRVASTASEEDAHPHHDAPDRVILSPQARANLKLAVRPIQLETYSRTLTIPGMVVERLGRTDRGVTSPIAGVVRRIAAVPGDTVSPGDELFTLRVTSEPFQSSQTELYKNTHELAITQEQRKRLEEAAKGGAIPEARLLELDYQARRVTAALQALRYDLAARGLSPEQIQRVAEGKFITEITIRVLGNDTGVSPAATGGVASASGQQPAEGRFVYEVQELKVQLGEQVQAGQTLATLANHQALFIEGRVFKQEAPLLEQAAQKGWPVRAEFAMEPHHHWSALVEPLKIRFLANRVDPASQTIPAYALLANEYREYTEGGQTYRIWRYRPGQRVRLRVPVEQFEGVFVLPVEAIVREGPDAFVFRANGDALDRKPVQVVYEDRQHVVVANDGSINLGNHIAFNGAAQLNRVLKAKAAGEGGHGHDHHGHSH